MPLFDTHCHLDDPRFADDRAAVIERAIAAGVERMTTIGCADTPDAVGRALDIAKAAPERITATVGVHPHDASKLDDALFAALEAAAHDPLVVAIGETGLDYHYDHSPRPAQQAALRRQIALARAVGKPLVIHTRSAPEDTLAILRDERARDVGGIIHCFSEDAPFAKAALDLGFVSSFSGIATFRSAEAVREAARALPSDAILVETDAPYLAPIPHRGRRNEPAYVEHTAALLARERGEAREAFDAATFANALRVYGLA
ncbi:MAG: TatD family hydrolase [Myxococcales bacterium]|nr:TatD family hydrolase [Myxococcales bacterium]